MSDVERLVGWKEISGYLKKSVRTIQRWEHDLGLPIRRVRTGPGQSVFAFPRELDDWLTNQNALPPEETTPSEEPEPTGPPPCTEIPPALAGPLPATASSKRPVFTSAFFAVIIAAASLGVRAGLTGATHRPLRGSPVYLMTSDRILVADSATSEVVRSIQLPADAPFSAFAAATVTPDGRGLTMPTVRRAGMVTFQFLSERFEDWRELPAGYWRRTVKSVDGKTAVAIDKYGQILQIDTSTGASLRDVSIPRESFDIVATPDGSTLIALSRDAGTLTFLDARSLQIVGVLETANGAHDIVLTPDGRTAVVSNEYSNSVSCVDVQQRRLIRTSPVGSHPIQLAMAHDGQTAFVSNRDSYSVSVVDVESCAIRGALMDAVVGARPWAIGVAGDGRSLYVAGHERPVVAVYDLTGESPVRRAEIPVPSPAVAIHAARSFN